MTIDREKAADGGKNDPGKDNEDRDILGKHQDDLTSEDLKGDTREGESD